MGTPRASASLDQMRRMQMSASGGGECAVDSALKRGRSDSLAGSGVANATATVAGMALMFCWSAPDFAKGCTGDPVRSCDISQQALFAQQFDWHACSLEGFEAIQDRAESRSGTAMNNAATSDTEIIILLNIALSL